MEKLSVYRVHIDQGLIFDGIFDVFNVGEDPLTVVGFGLAPQSARTQVNVGARATYRAGARARAPAAGRLGGARGEEMAAGASRGGTAERSHAGGGAVQVSSERGSE